MSADPGGKLVLIGFMGAGKSTAARAAADALGTTAVDLDEVLEQEMGRPIDQIFAQEGEHAFRAAEETAALALLSAPDAQVLSLGGGTVLSERVRQALEPHRVVWLDVDEETAWTRTKDTGRPLAQERSGFGGLLQEREAIYRSLADVIVPGEWAEHLPRVLERLTDVPEQARVLWAASASGEYPVYVAGGLLERGFWPASLDGRRFLVTDDNVGARYGAALEPIAAGLSIQPGERSKTLATAQRVWSEMAGTGITRQDLVVALGGGVVGDLAGFCAATYQRGIAHVQVPTTLVAQVDSAYGGKTGVDLPEAKNYVGAYHQPAAVVVDPEALASLPGPELAAGYAEVLKTALIAGGELWHAIRRGADPSSSEIILACIQTKLRIVARDERDGGVRQVLNLGHTVGHAIETVTGYERYRHGEAVGLGLLVALRLSDQEGLRQEVVELLGARGLPTRLDGVDPEAVVAATARDKKRQGEGPVPFVLLERPGAPKPGQAVPPDTVLAAVRELAA